MAASAASSHCACDLKETFPLLRCMSESGIRHRLEAHHFRTAAGLSLWICAESLSDQHLPSDCRLLHLQREDAQKGHFTQVAIVGGTDAVFVAWRDTQTQTDVASDMACVTFPHRSGNDVTLKLHGGFNTLLENDVRANVKIMTAIIQQHASKKKVIFVGHSAGGAVAIIALLRSYFPSMSCEDELRTVLDQHRENFFAITFGAPMVMASYGEQENQALAGEVKEMLESYMNEHCFIFVNVNDIVPRLPGHIQYLLDNPDPAYTRLVDKLVDGPFKRALAIVVPYIFSKVAPQSKKSLLELLEESRDKVKCYRPIGCVLKLGQEGDVQRVIDSAGLLYFDADHEAMQSGSMCRDHLMMEYVAKTRMVTQPVADEPNSDPIIASFKPPAHPQTWWEFCFGKELEYLNELQICAERQNLARIARSCSSLEEPSRVITFNGNSTSGKSFVIANLIDTSSTDASSDPQKPFHAKQNKLGLTTTAGASLFWSEMGYLMDCEGTKGSEDPATLPMLLRDLISRRNLEKNHRREVVKSTLPPLSMMLAAVFCYVTRECPGNASAYDEVLEYATQANKLVQNCEKSALIVIQNKVHIDEIEDNDADLTQAFLRHEGAGRPLRGLFSSVRVVQIPMNDRNEPSLLQRHIGNLRAIILEEWQTRLSICKALQEPGLTQKEWFSAVGQVIDGLACGKPVSMATVLNKVRFHPGQDLLKDVEVVYTSLLSSPLLEFETLTDLEKAVESARTEAVRFAGKIIAQGARQHKVTDLAVFSHLLQDLLHRLVQATP